MPHLPLQALEPDTVPEPKPRLKVKSFEHHSPKKRPYRPKSLWFSSVKEDKSPDNHFSNSDSAGRELPKQNKECLPPRQAYSHSSSLGSLMIIFLLYFLLMNIHRRKDYNPPHLSRRICQNDYCS